MGPTTPVWGKEIATEEINGVPYRVYKDRPRRVSDLFAFAERWGARPHIIQGERVITFEDLRNASDAKARELIAAGVQGGDRVFVLGWNSPEWVVNFWGCVRIGAVPVAANAWWSEAELEQALTLLEPVLLLADSRNASKISTKWRRGRWEMDTSTKVAHIGNTPLSAASSDENDPAVIIFTSGTEGRAKAVVLPHRSFLSQLQMLLHITRRLPHQIDDDSGEVSLHTGPLFHIGGAQALFRGVTVGNTLVFPRGKYEPGEALELIERHRVSRWNAVPTMATRLLEHPEIRNKDLSSLRAMTLGGAPVHSEFLKRVREGLPNIEPTIATGYGLSENAGQATAASGTDTTKRPGSTGRPLPCVELRILPREGYSDGEVLVRSPTQMLEYFGEKDSPIDAEGWLHTGDLGRIDQDGHLWITGRCKDLIIRGGENISPAAVEAALTSIPGVSEAVVFGLPHPELGEEVMAIVVTAEHTAEELQAQLRSTLASFAVPSRWRIQTEPLPVNLTGKVDKPALVAQARAERVQENLSVAGGRS